MRKGSMMTYLHINKNTEKILRREDTSEMLVRARTRGAAEERRGSELPFYKLLLYMVNT